MVRGMDETRPLPREYQYTEGKDAARRFEGLVKYIIPLIGQDPRVSQLGGIVQ